MNIMFKKYGNSLGTRIMGEEIRKSVELEFDNNRDVCFDFLDVNVISHSYADEIFGKLARKYGLDTMRKLSSFKNANEFVSSTIIEVLNS